MAAHQDLERLLALALLTQRRQRVGSRPPRLPSTTRGETPCARYRELVSLPMPIELAGLRARAAMQGGSPPRRKYLADQGSLSRRMNIRRHPCILNFQP